MKNPGHGTKNYVQPSFSILLRKLLVVIGCNNFLGGTFLATYLFHNLSTFYFKGVSQVLSMTKNSVYFQLLLLTMLVLSNLFLQ